MLGALALYVDLKHLGHLGGPAPGPVGALVEYRHDLVLHHGAQLGLGVLGLVSLSGPVSLTAWSGASGSPVPPASPAPPAPEGRGLRLRAELQRLADAAMKARGGQWSSSSIVRAL